jgi:hypothetical protein
MLPAAEPNKTKADGGEKTCRRERDTAMSKTARKIGIAISAMLISAVAASAVPAVTAIANPIAHHSEAGIGWDGITGDGMAQA